MKHDQTEKAERLFCALGELDPKTVASAAAYTPKTTRKGSNRRILVAILAATLTLCLVTLTVFAAVPSLRHILNLPFLREGGRQDTVPEGWVGIYTTEDLDSIRNDLDGKYILMNDLTFDEGAESFAPIGSADSPFVGRFDGNGYVIRGLKLNATQEVPPVAETQRIVEKETRTVTYHDAAQVETLYVGLFGFCGGHNEFPGTSDVYPYLHGDKPYEGMISNLGLENVTVTVTDAANVYAGLLAGHASYLAGCYVKDCSLTVSGYTPTAEYGTVNLYAGGLAGQAQLMDSCYARSADVTLANTDDLYITPYVSFAGALAGDAYTIITSYADACSVVSDAPEASVGELWGHVCLIPRLMNSDRFFDVYEKYYRATHEMSADEPLPEDWIFPSITSPDHDWADFYCKKFYSYFVPKELWILTDYMGMDFDDLNPALLMGEFSPDYVMYVYDPAVTVQETIMMETELTEKLGVETLSEIMTYDNFKIGPLYCYTLDPAKTYKKSDFAEFNFDTIWKMQDGRPALRIFED